MFAQTLGHDADKVDQDFGRLYRNVMKEFKCAANLRSGHRYFSMLWQTVAPKGNIYRRNGLFSEHRKHSEDLWAQLRELADRHAELLGGAEVPLEDRADRLHDALAGTQVIGRVLPDNGKPDARDEEFPGELDVGFPPLEEWLREKVWRCGPFLVNEDRDRRSEETKHVLMGVCVFGLQVIAPLIIFMNRWDTETNYLRSWQQLKHHLAWRHLACIGKTVHDALTTMMGVLLLFVVIFMVHCYVKEELLHAHKSSRMATDSCWLFIGMFANAWGCCFIVFNIPLLFWSEPTPVNIVLDSMTLLFLFKLDDLSDILCSYMEMTDEDFQRLSAWSSALLSQCPLAVEDLIKADAKDLEELWSIRYDETGRLCSTKGDYALTRMSHRFSEEECTERTPIVANEKHHDGTRIIYRPSRDKSVVLPSTMASTFVVLWDIVSWTLVFAQFVIPIGWYLANKRCSDW